MFILTGEFSSSLRKHIYFPKEDKNVYSLQCLFNCKEALQVERSPPITKRHISEHPGLLCCPCPLILWTVHQIVNSLLLPTCLEDGRMEGSHRCKIMWQQRQPLGLFRGACAERTTQENKGERVCELLTLFPTYQWGDGWQEQAFKFPEVGVFMGPSDKEPKRVRICEQQVENYQELLSPTCRLNHFSEVRGSWVHFPPLRSFDTGQL